jgi:hypothetical protein
MEKPVSELMAAISPEEWAQVPASVLELIQELVRRMDRFEKEISELRAENEQIAKTSADLSLPPSKNPLGFKPSRKEPRGRQIGHKGHERYLFSPSICLVQEKLSYFYRCFRLGSSDILGGGFFSDIKHYK